jgi:hypothetical protein
VHPVEAVQCCIVQGSATVVVLAFLSNTYPCTSTWSWTNGVCGWGTGSLRSLDAGIAATYVCCILQHIRQHGKELVLFLLADPRLGADPVHGAVVPRIRLRPSGLIPCSW